MSVSITELMWQAKPRGQTIPTFFSLPLFNGCHFYYKAKSSQTAVPGASTRCQQTLERVSFWFLENEPEIVVFLNGSQFGCSVSNRVKRACSLVFFSCKDNNDSTFKIWAFIYILGYLRFDYKRCLTCLEKFISNVWDLYAFWWKETGWIIDWSTPAKLSFYGYKKQNQIKCICHIHMVSRC